MSYVVSISPSGRIHVNEESAPDASPPKADMRKVARAFAACQSEGLFMLAAGRLGASLQPALAFLANFAGKYLTQLCRNPMLAGKDGKPIPPPDSSVLAMMLLGVPPMRGAEYLTPAAMANLWRELDNWVRTEAASLDRGPAELIEKRAPLWHHVGRVCFHLAENKQDSDYPFAFMATYAPSLSRGARVQYQPLSRALAECADSGNRDALVSLLSPVQLAAESSPLVKELVDSGDIFHPLAWTPGEAYQFLKQVPSFEECGVLMRLPNWWQKRPRPRVSVTIGDGKRGKFGADAMLDFNVKLALGDKTLSEQELQALMAGDDGLVLLKGKWVEVDREKLEEALSHWKTVEQETRDGGISFIEGMRLLAGAPADLNIDPDGETPDRPWAFVQAGTWLKEMLANLRDPENLKQADSTGALNATLRPYQQTGVNWLWFMNGLRLGACLADDMGLGKTMQVLSLLLSLKKQKGPTSLLVLPASLLANWKAEIKKFAPSLSVKFAHASENSKDELAAMAENPDEAMKGVDLVATTYGMLLRQEWLRERQWRLIILDEAQAIKNPAARQSRVIKKLNGLGRIALTGTPIENRLSDLWSLFDFLCPGLLGSAAKFRKFVKSLSERQGDYYAPLRNLVAPYILRRLKTDKRVINDLPEKTEVRAFCSLSKAQGALYAKSVNEMAEAMENLDGMQRRGLVLAYILRFKQICNHPSQWLGDGQYSPADSGKFARLREICEEMASRQQRAIIFTQFRSITGPIHDFLADVFARPGLILHGGTAIRKRGRMIEQFQAEDGPPFIVLSLKAGGTGLNLTAASHVIHFDRWWNPAVENQATDRAFRIGQKQNVLVHKFVCRGTIEEKIDALIEEKTQLAQDVVEGGAGKMLTEMSDKELLKFVALDLEKAGV